LVKLATSDPPPQELQEKLERVRNEPFVNNEAAFEGAKPNAPPVKELGAMLRIAEWNFNRTPRESRHPHRLLARLHRTAHRCRRPGFSRLDRPHNPERLVV
jgi:hypothetical protein